jgi:hypothetical protein
MRKHAKTCENMQKHAKCKTYMQKHTNTNNRKQGTNACPAIISPYTSQGTNACPAIILPYIYRFTEYISHTAISYFVSTLALLNI